MVSSHRMTFPLPERKYFWDGWCTAAKRRENVRNRRYRRIKCEDRRRKKREKPASEVNERVSRIARFEKKTMECKGTEDVDVWSVKIV